MVNAPYVVGILDALKEAKEIELDRELVSLYEQWIEENPFDQGVGWAGEPRSQKEMPVSLELAEDVAKRNDAAVIIIGRSAGEDQDNTNERGSFLLTGRMAVAQLRGMDSQGVTGTIKHFACNNQENRRHFADSVVSERAAREVYLKPFQMVIADGKCYTVMSSYGPVNGKTEEWEILNQKESAAAKISYEKNITYADGTEFSLSDMPVAQGMRAALNMSTAVKGFYRMVMSVRSAAGPLAQMPVTIYNGSQLVETITVNGTEGKWTTIETMVVAEAVLSNRMILQFGLGGIEFGTVKMVLEKGSVLN